MDLLAIRYHLLLGRVALGLEHPLSSRINTVERHLTLGDPLWCNDAVSAEADLLGITTELGQLPEVMTPGPIATAECVRAAMLLTVNAAMKHIADAIELL